MIRIVHAAPTQPVPFQQFQSEVLDIYRSTRRKGTTAKVRQILGELAPLCSSTSDVNLHSISLWIEANHRRAISTKRNLLSALRSACSLGAELHYMDNPFWSWSLSKALPLPDPEDLDRPWLVRTQPEICRLKARASAEATGGDWRSRRTKALVFLAAYTGARARELLGAQVRDVDLVGAQLHIRPNSRRPLKTAASRRVLPIHPELLDCLRAWIPDAGSQWLLPQRSGLGPWFHGSPGYRPVDCVQQLGERCSVDGLTISAFRHTFASLAELWGWSELQIQRWLGHTRPSTQRWYRPRPVAELLVRAAELIRY